jgi:CheY-like chemotaxis protein
MITPNDIRLVIMSVRRSPQYIHKTLASLSLSDSLVHSLKGIHVVVGGSETEYLASYRHHKIVNIHPLELGLVNETEASTVQSLRRRFNINYYRSLTLPPSDCSGLCICEDDVIFRDGFVGMLTAAVNELEEKHQITEFLLDLYAPYGFRVDPSWTGRLCVKYDKRIFYGTQCMYYSRKVVERIAQEFYNNGMDPDRLDPIPGDLLLGQYIEAHNMLYGVVPSLVQHIGVCSTGLAGSFHHAPSFQEEFPDVDNLDGADGNRKSAEVAFDVRECICDAVKPFSCDAHPKGLELICDVGIDIPDVVTGACGYLKNTLTTMVREAVRSLGQGELVLRVRKESQCNDQVCLCFSLVFSDVVSAFQGEALVAVSTDDVMTPAYFIQQFRSVAESRTNPCRTPVEELRDVEVLIVDDSNRVRNVLTEMVGQWGMRATAVDNATIALQLLHERYMIGDPFWLVLVDAEMPIVDGWALARHIKKTPGLFAALIMMANFGQAAHNCRELGISQFLLKPIVHFELLEAIRFFLEMETR